MKYIKTSLNDLCVNNQLRSSEKQVRRLNTEGTGGLVNEYTLVLPVKCYNVSARFQFSNSSNVYQCRGKIC